MFADVERMVWKFVRRNIKGCAGSKESGSLLLPCWASVKSKFLSMDVFTNYGGSEERGGA